MTCCSGARSTCRPARLEEAVARIFLRFTDLSHFVCGTCFGLMDFYAQRKHRRKLRWEGAHGLGMTSLGAAQCHEMSMSCPSSCFTRRSAKPAPHVITNLMMKYDMIITVIFVFASEMCKRNHKRCKFVTHTFTQWKIAKIFKCSRVRCTCYTLLYALYLCKVDINNTFKGQFFTMKFTVTTSYPEFPACDSSIRDTPNIYISIYV